MAKEKLEFKVSLDAKPMDKGLKQALSRSKRFKAMMGRIWGSLKKIMLSPFTALVGASAIMYKFFASVKQGAEDFIKLESAFADINSLIDGPGGLTESSKKFIKEQAKMYGTTAVDNAKAFYDIVSGGIRDQESAQKLLNTANKAAITGNESVKATTESLLAVMKAYGQENVSAAEAGDVLQTVVNRGIITWPKLAANLSTVTALAAKTGVEFKELGALIASITGSKVDAPETMTYIRGLLTSLIQSKGAAGKAIQKELGFDWSVEAVKAEGFTKVFSQLIEKIGEAPDKVKALIPNIRGVMGALTGKDFKETMEFFANPTGALDEAFKEKAKTIEAKIARAKQASAALWRSEDMAKVLLQWEKFKVILGHIVPRLIDIVKIIGKVGAGVAKWTGLKWLWNLGSKGPTPWQKDLKRIEDPTEEQLKEDKQQELEKKKEKIQKAMEKTAVEAEEKRVKLLEAAHEKISELTKTSVSAIVRGVEAIREKTAKAIEAIKKTFFGGSSLEGLGAARKIFEENRGAKDAFRSLANVADVKSLTGGGMAQLAEVAKALVNNQQSISDFLSFLRQIKKIRGGAMLSAGDIKGAYGAFNAGAVTGTDAFNMLKNAMEENAKQRALQGEEEERKYLIEAEKKLTEAAIKIVQSADKQLHASDVMDKASRLIKESVDKQASIMRQPIKVQLTDKLGDIIEQENEVKRRSGTAGPGIPGP